MHAGFVSSHFFFLRRHVPQPVFDRAWAAFFCSAMGCFLGLPRLRGRATWSATPDFDSSISSSALSSISSTLGTTVDDSSSSLSGVITESVVNSGDELEAVEVYAVETVLGRLDRDSRLGEMLEPEA